jgi:hypothetical protein
VSLCCSYHRDGFHSSSDDNDITSSSLLLESSMFESHDGVRASCTMRRSGLMKFSRALRQKGIASISVHAGEGKSA